MKSPKNIWWIFVIFVPFFIWKMRLCTMICSQSLLFSFWRFVFDKFWWKSIASTRSWAQFNFFLNYANFKYEVIVEKCWSQLLFPCFSTKKLTSVLYPMFGRSFKKKFIQAELRKWRPQSLQRIRDFKPIFLKKSCSIMNLKKRIVVREVFFKSSEIILTRIDEIESFDSS